MQHTLPEDTMVTGWTINFFTKSTLTSSWQNGNIMVSSSSSNMAVIFFAQPFPSTDNAIRAAYLCLQSSDDNQDSILCLVVHHNTLTMWYNEAVLLMRKDTLAVYGTYLTWSLYWGDLINEVMKYNLVAFGTYLTWLLWWGGLINEVLKYTLAVFET